MSLKIPRPVDPSLHPLVTGNYRLATPAIEGFYELVTRCLRYRIMGALIYGPSRVGKTRAIEYVRLLLAREYPKITTYHAQCEHKPRHAEGPFFATLLEAVGDTCPNAGTTSTKRTRLSLRIREAAARAGSGTVILFCDEAQRLNDHEYEWLRDVHDALDRQQIKLFTFLVGQEELLAQKTALQVAHKTQIVARLMVEELAFSGIRNAEDVATCLNGYDQTAYPERTPWSFTRFYVPQSFDAGYRLTSDATVLWQAFENAHHKASLPGILDLLWNHSHALSRSCSRTASSRTHQATAPTRLCGLTRYVTAVTFSLDMPPDACLRRRNPAALKPPRFPILAFDERELRLALGSVFNLKWLVPGESLVSILWKFGCANALAADFLVQLIDPDIDPSVGVAPVREVVNLMRLRRLLRLPENVLHASLLDAAVPGRYHPAFRYCRQCAAHGYHSVLYQLNDEDRCPAHLQSLETRCLHCGEETPYIVNASLVEAPFRCVSCHSHFSYGRLSLLSTTPAMRRRDRAAICHRLRVRSDDKYGRPSS